MKINVQIFCIVKIIKYSYLYNVFNYIKSSIVSKKKVKKIIKTLIDFFSSIIIVIISYTLVCVEFYVYYFIGNWKNQNGAV